MLAYPPPPLDATTPAQRPRPSPLPAGGGRAGELVEFTQAENMMQHLGEYYIDPSLTGRATSPPTPAICS